MITILEEIKKKVERVLLFDQEGAVPQRGDLARQRQDLLELLEEDIPFLFEKVEDLQNRIKKVIAQCGVKWINETLEGK